MPPSKSLLKWFDTQGRHDLPWQKNINPYRVWISEIMLQQTQVSTVIPYYNRFMETFPTIQDLAKASEDEVLHLWTGLGYYARGRNLHKTAKKIVTEFKGNFPNEIETVSSLPGIGRSTAGAILSIAFKIRAPILDGNVRRVLSRLYCVEGIYNEKNTQAQLWQLAEKNTPHTRVADYTQAIMDLGATLCTRSKPDCPHCPLQSLCLAFKTDRVSEFPNPKKSKTLETRKIKLLILQNTKGEICLEKRPAQGVWGGLWSLPEFSGSKAELAKLFAKPVYQPPFRHTFTHFHLEISPVLIQVDNKHIKKDSEQKIWYKISQVKKLGLPAPVKKILESVS